MDMIPPGSKMASKAFTIIYYAELGKPYVFLIYIFFFFFKVLKPQGREMAQRVEERDKKRMALL